MDIIKFTNKEIKNLSDLNYWGTEENINNENIIFDYALKNKIVKQDWFDSRLKHTNVERLEDLLKEFYFMEKTFHWNEDTLQHFVDRLDADGWAAVAIHIYEFVHNECDLEDGETELDLFTDLCEQVQEKDFTDNHLWAQ